MNKKQKIGAIIVLLTIVIMLAIVLATTEEGIKYWFKFILFSCAPTITAIKLVGDVINGDYEN